MVAPKKSKSSLKKMNRDEKVIKEFDKQRKGYPEASIPDCIRGLAEAFDVNEITIRRALKKAERI